MGRLVFSCLSPEEMVVCDSKSTNSYVCWVSVIVPGQSEVLMWECQVISAFQSGGGLLTLFTGHLLSLLLWLTLCMCQRQALCVLILDGEDISDVCFLVQCEGIFGQTCDTQEVAWVWPNGSWIPMRTLSSMELPG